MSLTTFFSRTTRAFKLNGARSMKTPEPCGTRIPESAALSMLYSLVFSTLGKCSVIRRYLDDTFLKIALMSLFDKCCKTCRIMHKSEVGNLDLLASFQI